MKKNLSIEVKELKKKYKKSEKYSVDNVNLNVKKGEFFSLLGPNGAGKTTTISILTTILKKTSGEVLINGLDIDKNASEVRKKIGVIFQNPSLDLNLTAEENIRFHTSLYGVFPFRPAHSLMPKQYKDKVDELSEIIGLGNEVFKPIKTFSGGMKRKLEIIRSLMHSPNILFLDEPTSGLDPASRKGLWEYLKEVRKKSGITIFLTTHYLEEAEESDTVCIIHHGKVVASDKPEKLKERLVNKYLILDSKYRNKLLINLDKLGLKYEIDKNVKVYLKNNNVQKIIQEITVPLSKLQIYNPTLEDAYLNIIANGNEKNN